MQSNYQNSINTALKELATTKSISSGLLVCNTLLEHMGVETKTVEDIELSKLKLPNAERYDRWFDAHPHFRGDRACFDLTPKVDLLEAKFYALQKRSKLFIAGSVTFTPNFEDREYTRTDPSMKVGIDFFLTPEKDAVIVVLSNKGSLRLVELSGRLTNTQHDIFTVWHNVAQLADKNALHTTIWDSFKLSSLNKKFYEGIANSFTTLTQHLQKDGVEEQLANQFANRLHGRLLFLWFLRKKHIINETKEYFTLGDQDDTKYYTDTLSTLFFNVLNNEDHKEVDAVTPYLNGGLFDQDADGEYWKSHKPTFPTGFFKALYDHFDSFNFTTDESTPEYEQIAIDPEMLGRIFESFLATLKTETGAQAKKANGAFYTPREIVSYMSRESLRQYLYTTLDASVALKSSIDELLDRPDSEWALAGTNSKRDTVAKEDRERIMDALRNIRVLDPAVGSGAFPMGVLHKMLNIFERLDPNFDSYETKLSILRNNIYGVDIDPTAIEIARLRAWLSVIVDVEDIKKIKPLPNLDFKFVCANTLIGLDASKQASLMPDLELKSTLMRIRDEYYATSSKTKKERLQKEYTKLTHKESLFDAEETRQLKSYQPFESGVSASFYDTELMHGVAAFDVIIGNPPYVFTRDADFSEDFKEKIDRTYAPLLTGSTKKTKANQSGKINLFALFILRGNILCDENGSVNFIIPNNILRTTTYDLVRKYILENTQIQEIVDLGGGVFDGVTASTIIFRMRKVAALDTHTVDVITNVQNIERREYNTSKIVQAQFLGNVSYALNIFADNSIIGLINKINNNKSRLGEYCTDIIEGIVAHKHLVVENPTSNSQPLVEGKMIKRFYLTPINKYIIWEVDKIHRTRPITLWKLPRKILIQRISGGNNPLTATLDDNSLKTFASVNNLVLKKNFESMYEFILALLNSKVLNWFYANSFSNNSKLTVNISKTFLEQLPIELGDSATRDKITELTKNILKTKKESPNTDTSALESKIDLLVYQLYGLNDSEIKIIEENT